MSGIAKRLQDLRESRRPTVSRKVVSELCGLHPDAIRRYERGEAVPTAEALVRIADYYKVSTDYLLGRTNY